MTSSENGSGILTISFDYAIKYLLKNKANFCVIEDFVSTILERAGYPKIKIVALEDPENQKSLAATRITIPDLLVQDEKGRRYLIEIERGKFFDAILKAHYNTSYSTVHDFLDKGEGFGKIRKIFHVSILYGSYCEVTDYIYHGRTVCSGMHNKQPLTIRRTGEGKLYNSWDDIPEYFYIFPDNFHEEFSGKLEEWMNILKKGILRKEAVREFQEFEIVGKRLGELSLSKEEKREYDKFQVDIATEESKIESARIDGKTEGIAQGKAEGRSEEKKEIAKSLLASGMPIETIATHTGLSQTQISDLS